MGARRSRARGTTAGRATPPLVAEVPVADAATEPGAPHVLRFTWDSAEYVAVAVPADPADAPPLTAAERHVARLIIAGRSNRDIAKARGTSVRTVANQIAGLLRKLGVKSRSELVASWAGRLGD